MFDDERGNIYDMPFLPSEEDMKRLRQLRKKIAPFEEDPKPPKNKKGFIQKVKELVRKFKKKKNHVD